MDLKRSKPKEGHIMSYEEEKATNHNMLDVICG